MRCQQVRLVGLSRDFVQQLNSREGYDSSTVRTANLIHGLASLGRKRSAIRFGRSQIWPNKAMKDRSFHISEKYVKRSIYPSRQSSHATA